MEPDLQPTTCDVLVIGGGINGAGIARDAAGRGLSVVLCEKDDLASHTSSASTKLIHGGLRYLEQYEFRLVRKALIEREVLLRSAPHIMHPLRFIMPHDAGQRPAWLIRAGLFLYDHLARRALLPASGTVDLQSHPAGAALKPQFRRGFVYSDGWVDDARLVVLNAMDAALKGATVLTRARCESAARHDGAWTVNLRGADGEARAIRARCLVNAAGPWAAHLHQEATHQASEKPVRLVKGSHIVVRRLFDHPEGYIFQHPDGRIVFALPYESDFTLIGTTDVEYHGDADQVAISQDEVRYLCELSNRYFRRTLSPDDVFWSYSGVRPLVEDPLSDASHVTRDYRLEWDTGGAPLLSIFGGKITTYRKLAEEAVDRLAAALGNRSKAWTGNASLPGGNITASGFGDFAGQMQRRYHWLPQPLVTRYARAYGTRIDVMLSGRVSMNDMGEEIGPWLYAAEAEYLLDHEWATCAADILWRRSKLGLHLPPETVQRLDAWIAARRKLTAA
jgi:glycerol-3-phosphate dehydrogenase